jgi:hypothetical protein
VRCDRVSRDHQLLAGGGPQLQDQVGDRTRDLELLPQIPLLTALNGEVDEAADVTPFLLRHDDLARSNARCRRRPARKERPMSL